MSTTNFLFAENSFLSGMGRVLDLGSTRKKTTYNHSSTPKEADYKAIKNDWSVVGDDLWGAMNDFEEKYETKILQGIES